MSKKSHKTGSRLPDLATEPGEDSGGLSGAAFASPAPGARASDAGSLPGASPSGSDPSGGAWSGAVPVPGQDAVVRRTADGWRVGDDDLPDLTCAMVLANLLAAAPAPPTHPALPA